MLSRLMATYPFTDHVSNWSIFPADNPNPHNLPQSKHLYFYYKLETIPARIMCAINVHKDAIEPAYRQHWADKMMLELAKKGEL